MELTPEQSAVMMADGDLVVVAGAGSGKTRVLVERYVRLLIETGDPDRLLAITFTEKAARELRERVRRALDARMAQAAGLAEVEHWEELRAAVEGARIGTIHSFCAALLRAHPAEALVDPSFAVLDEVEAALLRGEAVEAALVGLLPAYRPGAPELAALEELSLDEVRAALVELLAAGHAARTAIAAMPASVEQIVARWRSQLEQAIADTRQELLADAALQAALAELQALQAGAPAADRIGAQVHAAVAALADGNLTALDEINLQGGSKKHWGSDHDLAQARAALRQLRDSYRLRKPVLGFVWDDQHEHRAALAAWSLSRMYTRAAEQYAALKRARAALDFDDLEWGATRLLNDRPQIARRWNARLAEVLVDEFQDTNRVQRDIVAALTEGTPRHARLFVVGDRKQSIYRFRGADVEVFQHVQQLVAARGGRTLPLDRSFRTHAGLVALFNDLFARLFGQPDPARPYEVEFTPLVAQRPRPAHTRWAELHLVDASGGEQRETAEQVRAAEAQVVVARLAQLVAGAEAIIYDRERRDWRFPRPGDIGILFQASSGFEPYEAALRAAGLPFLTTAGRGYYGRQEVRDLVHLLRFLDDPTDDLALVGVLRSPLCALSDEQIIAARLAQSGGLWPAVAAMWQTEIGVAVLAELLAMRPRATTVELLRAAFTRTGYLATISALQDGDRRRANVEKFLAAARLASGLSPGAFRAYLDRLLRVEARESEAVLEGEDVVRLMTIHASKGLEFPLVVLPDLGRRGPAQPPRWLVGSHGLALRLRGVEGLEDPSAFLTALMYDRRKDLAERTRLAYVAFTRAQDYLLLAGSTPGTPGEDWLSRLLDAMGYPVGAGGPPDGLFVEPWGMHVTRVGMR